MPILAGKNTKKLTDTQLITDGIAMSNEGLVLYFDYAKGGETGVYLTLISRDTNLSPTTDFYIMETDSTLSVIKWQRKITQSGCYTIPTPGTAKYYIFEFTPVGSNNISGTLTLSVVKNNYVGL